MQAQIWETWSNEFVNRCTFKRIRILLIRVSLNIFFTHLFTAPGHVSYFVLVFQQLSQLSGSADAEVKPDRQRHADRPCSGCSLSPQYNTCWLLKRPSGAVDAAFKDSQRLYYCRTCGSKHESSFESLTSWRKKCFAFFFNFCYFLPKVVKLKHIYVLV